MSGLVTDERASESMPLGALVWHMTWPAVLTVAAILIGWYWPC